MHSRWQVRLNLDGSTVPVKSPLNPRSRRFAARRHSATSARIAQIPVYCRRPANCSGRVAFVSMKLATDQRIGAPGI
jgi:hypothetical protein